MLKVENFFALYLHQDINSIREMPYDWVQEHYLHHVRQLKEWKKNNR